MLLTILVSLTVILLIAVSALLLARIAELNKCVIELEKKHSSDITAILTRHDGINTNQERGEKTFREEIARNREELNTSLKHTSEAIAAAMRDVSNLQNEQLNAFSARLREFGEGTYKQLQVLNEASRHDLTQMRSTIETNIKSLQDDNAKKLEEMRVTVDEKLQSTLEKRLTASFQQVSERLEQVHKGLGEMQSLASGVGDLKKVLTNVKTRGTWGEIQLANLLEQVLSPEQYEANVQTKPKTQERVDFAIKLPGNTTNDAPVWLPLDSKFPQEDYHRLIEAQESANPELAEQAMKQLEARIKLEAKSIRDKYIEPPFTTDFALMFLPTEGLYAEVIRRPGLVDKIQLEYRVNVVGPTTLAALLNALQMGFRTLTIQKRSSEVWSYLADVKKHFGAFGDLLAKAHERIRQASDEIEKAGTRSRTIENKLKKFEELPGSGVDAIGTQDVIPEPLLGQMQKN